MSDAFERAREKAKVTHSEFLQMQFGDMPANPSSSSRASGSQVEEPPANPTGPSSSHSFPAHRSLAEEFADEDYPVVEGSPTSPPSSSPSPEEIPLTHKRKLVAKSKSRPDEEVRPRDPRRRREAVPPLIDRSRLPSGYGDWGDWNSEAAIAKESELAELAGLKYSMRGPVPPSQGGPELWKDIPFDPVKNMWTFSSRSTLPTEYTSIQDMWSEDGLKEEARLAGYYHIPWSLRGPASGPQGGHVTWRGLHWREGTQKWMARGGKIKSERDWYYRK